MHWPAFLNLCAYSSSRTFPRQGTVDHFRSCKNAPELAYEWTNYRHCSARINQYKGMSDEDVLDPFEIEDDWFEIILPSMQLVPTDKLPDQHRKRALYTLERLRLLGGPSDNWVVRQRRSWYRRYLNGKAPLELLDEFAPMIARAIRKRDAAQQDARTDE